MSVYITIKGGKVQSLASDPSNPIEGQVWYNSATGLLKFYNGTAVQTVTAS